MTAGERIGVHHYGSVAPFSPEPAQVSQVRVQTTEPVFHQHSLAGFGQQSEAQAREDSDIRRFREEFYRAVSFLSGYRNQLGDEFVGQAFAPCLIRDGHTFDDISAEPSACKNRVAVLAPGDCHVAVDRIQPQAVCGEEVLHPLPHGRERQRQDADMVVSAHIP